MPSSADAPDTSHTRPDGASDSTVEAVGKLSKAVETMERARGHLYEFHQLSGTTDLQLQEAVGALRDAGHAAIADRLQHELVGRNVIADRWTFQIVEDYDAGYYPALRSALSAVEAELMAGRQHVFEAEMKRREIDASAPRQEPGPGL